MIGTKLAHYEINSHLGTGGMGEVYQATDSKLGRSVAIKLLPEAFTHDKDWVTRFEREARVLASLNHPNIAAIYGVEETSGRKFLVMELVPGETLAERIKRGPIPVDETVRIAKEIAEALEAAHEKGVIHRDLKPANVKVTPEGRVKVLDFGLAKAFTGDGGQDLSQAPTLTEEGRILGTPSYMSPEQARGRAVDKRTDIWAFSCVFYEMLTGRTAFAGATVTDTLVAILEQQPQWEALPASTPVSVRRLLQRCLEKDSKRRLRDIGDARLELEDPAGTLLSTETSTRARLSAMRLTPWAIAAFLLVAIVVLIGLERLAVSSKQPSSDGRASGVRMVLTRATADDGVTADPAISRDGALLAYASDRAGLDNLDIWVQQTVGSTPIELSHDSVDESEPAFSPDGSSIAFRSERAGGGIYIVPALGGQEPRLLVPSGRRPRFSPDGRFVAYWTGTNIGFGQATGSYRTFIVPAAGGMPREIGGFTGARYPVWSRDGTSLLVLASSAPVPLAPTYDWWIVPRDGGAPVATGAYEQLREGGITTVSGNIGPGDWRDDQVFFSDYSYIWSLRLNPRTGRASELERLTFGTNHDAQPSVAGSGRIAFSSASITNNVWALPLDANRGIVTGAPRRLTTGSGIDARASATGDGQIIAYHTLTPKPAILVKDLRSGRLTDLGVAGSNFGPAISPDGTRVVYESEGGLEVISTHGGSPRTICQKCQTGDWSTDGSLFLVVKQEGNSGRLASIDVDAGTTRELVVSPAHPVNRPFLSPDHQWLAFRVTRATGEAIMIVRVPAEGTPAERDWIQVVPDELDVRPCGWSPDGTLLYFVSSRDGTRCLYVQRIDRKTGRPQGDAIAVRHFHGTRNVWAGQSGVLSTGPANAVRGGFFLYDIGQYSANIWTMSTH